METSQFIDQLTAGNASEAKDTLNNLLSARAFESLDAKKVELAKSMFTDKEDSVEVQDTEEV
jgi:restriction endonuclease S subunit